MKFIKLFWQLLIFPVLYFPYQLLNQAVLVKQFGCGCPSYGENGKLTDKFNANDFTQLFWSFIVLTVVGISIYNLRYIKQWYYRIPYLAVIIAVSVYIAYHFWLSMQWM